MLRKQANFHISFELSRFIGQREVYLHLGTKEKYWIARMTPDRFEDIMFLQQTQPSYVAQIAGKTYWQFKDQIYVDTDNLKQDEVHALLVSRVRAVERRIANAKQTMHLDQRARAKIDRQSIPDHVKELVWMRDRGACGRCGAKSELQFDHIIPVSKGGANSPENLQILCGPCNRAKGARITS